MAQTTENPRAAARKRLEERRGFVPHLIVYLVINAGLVLAWAYSGPHGFFWPAVIMLLWGVGVIMHGWNAFIARPITEADIDRELNHHTDGGSDNTRTDRTD